MAGHMCMYQERYQQYANFTVLDPREGSKGSMEPPFGSVAIELHGCLAFINKIQQPNYSYCSH